MTTEQSPDRLTRAKQQLRQILRVFTYEADNDDFFNKYVQDGAIAQLAAIDQIADPYGTKAELRAALLDIQDMITKEPDRRTDLEVCSSLVSDIYDRVKAALVHTERFQG